MNGWITLIILLAIAAGIMAILYFLGKKAQARQEEQQAQIQAAKQTVSMLIIDKKRLRVRESGLPEAVMNQVPWYLRRSKLPIVKAKVGPQIINLIGDDKIFDSIPVKKEVKAEVSGLYIVGVKGLHGKSGPKEEVKKSWFKRTLDKAREKAGATPLK